MTALSVIGILVVRSATNMDSEAVTKQMFGILAGMAIAVCLSLVDYHKILNFSTVIYLICIGSLLAVLFWGRSVNNAKRWIVGSCFGTAPALGICKDWPYHHLLLVFYEISEKVDKVSTVVLAAALFAVPAMLIFEQPNLSTCLVTVVIVLGIVFASGISYRWIVGTLAVVIPMIATGVYLLLHGMIPFIKEYQAGRILAWFYPEQYGEARYQQNNSIMAIGSGRLTGKGLNNNTTTSVKNGNFILEPQTDFIFAIVGEELGFVGCCIVIVLLLLIVIQCIVIGIRARIQTGRIICCGVGSDRDTNFY